MERTLNVSQLTGTVTGLLTGQFFTMIHVESLILPAVVTTLTTTISFILPIFYKRLAKKYNLE